MVKNIFLSLLVVIAIAGLSLITKFSQDKETGAPPYQIEDLNPPEENSLSFLRNWKRPVGPPKVGLQVGHLNAKEVPEELKRLRGNTGATGGGKTEIEVNQKIAELTSDILKVKGVQVDILPATIPVDYWADVFVAIHADGSLDTTKSGFKLAHPRRDYTGKAPVLLSFIETEYENATGLPIDPNVTRNMRGYYAFAWWRYDHAVHPMTASVILETGFLTSPSDRRTIVSNPVASAQGLSSGIIKYLESESILN